MVVNVSVQHDDVLLPINILLTLCDYTLLLGNPFNTMKRFCPPSQCSHLNPMTNVPEGGCSEGLQ